MATHAHGKRSGTAAGRGAPPVVRCDGPCGEAYPATMLVLVGRYAICKSEIRGVRDFEHKQREAEARDPVYQRSSRQAMAEIVAAEGPYTESARQVRAYMGIA